MATPRKKSNKSQKGRKKEPSAPGGSSGEIDRDVDESPGAVEHRRESQSGPGATGVPHTGAGAADSPSAGTSDNPRPVPGHSHMRHTDDSDDDAREAMEDEAAAAEPEAEGRGDVLADEEGKEIPPEPESEKINPSTRHER